MSHIDAKAETKGVEARCPIRLSFSGTQCRLTAGHSGEHQGNIDDPPYPMLPQRHARINCNGKSCGEFNCDTCHPQACPSLAPDVSMEDLDVVTGYDLNLMQSAITAARKRAEKAEAELAALKATPKETNCPCGGVYVETIETQRFPYGIENPTTLTAFVPVSTCDKCGDAFTDWRGEKIREYVIANHLKVTPKAGKTFEEWLMGAYPAIAISSDIRPLLMRTAWNAAQSSPSLPLEEPEQVISDGDINWIKTFGSSTLCKAMSELEVHRRALAARRGGR